MVEASDWLHCPFDSSTLPSEKTVRMRQQGKAVGCVPLTALLFEQLLFLSPSRRLPTLAAFFRLDFCDHRR
jgi:hypothetical protein